MVFYGGIAAWEQSHMRKTIRLIILIQILHFWNLWVKGLQVVYRLSKLVDILEEALKFKCDEFANKGNLYSNNSLPWTIDLIIINYFHFFIIYFIIYYIIIKSMPWTDFFTGWKPPCIRVDWIYALLTETTMHGVNSRSKFNKVVKQYFLNAF